MHGIFKQDEENPIGLWPKSNVNEFFGLVVIYCVLFVCLHWMTTAVAKGHQIGNNRVISLPMLCYAMSSSRVWTEYSNKWGFCWMNNAGNSVEYIAPEQHSVPHSSSFKSVIFQ